MAVAGSAGASRSWLALLELPKLVKQTGAGRSVPGVSCDSFVFYYKNVVLGPTENSEIAVYLFNTL